MEVLSGMTSKQEKNLEYDPLKEKASPRFDGIGTLHSS
jgi:hypothetical protein